MEFDYRECLNQCINVRIEPCCCDNSSEHHDYDECCEMQQSCCCRTHSSCGCNDLMTSSGCGCR